MSSRGAAAAAAAVAVSCRHPKDTETEVIFIDHATAAWRAHVCMAACAAAEVNYRPAAAVTGSLRGGEGLPAEPPQFIQGPFGSTGLLS